MISRSVIVLAAASALFAGIGTHTALSQTTAPSTQAAPATQPRPATKSQQVARTKSEAHKVAIQVSDNDPKQMNLALNNARNVAEYFKTKGQKISIEIVTYGPGLHMLRDDTSPVKQRIAEMSLETPEIAFMACANTQANMTKQEGKQISLVSEAKMTPSGVVRLMELQQQGYAYIRP